MPRCAGGHDVRASAGANLGGVGCKRQIAGVVQAVLDHPAPGWRLDDDGN
jgi:hypothetical protein